MSFRLALQRDLGREQAIRTREKVEVPLGTHGVSFGSLTVYPDGRTDYRLVEGIDHDLVVKPFGWKGDIARLRDFITTASRIHFGIQAHEIALQHQTDPEPELLGDGVWYDPDDDGVARELEEGTVTAGAVYLALLEAPTILPPNDAGLRARWSRGSTQFDELGCSSCHIRTLHIMDDRWYERPPGASGPGVELSVLRDGEKPHPNAFVELFSDLKRHDMGPDLSDPVDHPLGIPRSHFLTRPLWGVAETGPFLHDGRATTLDEAIRWHGGEAIDSRDAYVALDPEAQRDLHIFLLSLTRAPRLRVQL